MPDDSTDQTESEDTSTDTSEDTSTDTSDNGSDDKPIEDAGEHNIYVRDTGGDGRAVVLIHGWPLSHESWSEQIPALTDAGYRVVAYDRRGFGKSGPGDSYGYDVLADDLDNVISDLELTDVTLVGFSMGGGEVARYASKHGLDKVHSVVFAAAIPPFLMQSDDNPDGPLTEDAANGMQQGLESDRDGFFDQFMTTFFSAGDDLKVSEEQRQEALALCKQSNQEAAVGCMQSFGTTDFREDLPKISVPTLVIHGDADGIVPVEGSGQRTHEAIEDSELVVVEGGPHGLNVSHTEEFNRALLAFLEK